MITRKIRAFLAYHYKNVKMSDTYSVLSIPLFCSKYASIMFIYCNVRLRTYYEKMSSFVCCPLCHTEPLLVLFSNEQQLACLLHFRIYTIVRVCFFQKIRLICRNIWISKYWQTRFHNYVNAEKVCYGCKSTFPNFNHLHTVKRGTIQGNLLLLTSDINTYLLIFASTFIVSTQHSEYFPELKH